MSFTKSDILARLQNGETADAIADEMATALNEAQKAYSEEKAETTRVYNAKREAALGIIDALCDYMVAAGEEELLDELQEIDEDKIIEMLDGSIKLAKSLEALKNLEFNIPIVEESCGSSSKEDMNESCECMNPLRKAFKITSKPATIKADSVHFDPDVIIKNFLKNI